MNSALVSLLLATSVASGLAGQNRPITRLEGRVPPAVARTVSAIADSAERQGLPVDPLVRKALEGSAKGVPAERIIAAVRVVATQLAEAAKAIRSEGLSPDADAIEAGAYAINAGVTPKDVGTLAGNSQRPGLLAASLQSTGTLVALGVPETQAVALVREWLQAGRSTGDVLLLPQQLQSAMAHGNSAAQAASDVARGSSNAPGAPRAPAANNHPPPHPQGPDHSHRP